MKYIIKNSDLFLNNKLHSEGSEIELTDEQAKGLESFLIPISVKSDSFQMNDLHKKLNTKGNKK
jgi:hypothetical protein